MYNANNYQRDSMAQWIRRWSTEPEILGSIPSGVVLSFFSFFKHFGIYVNKYKEHFYKLIYIFFN